MQMRSLASCRRLIPPGAGIAREPPSAHQREMCATKAATLQVKTGFSWERLIGRAFFD